MQIHIWRALMSKMLSADEKRTPCINSVHGKQSYCRVGVHHTLLEEEPYAVFS